MTGFIKAASVALLGFILIATPALAQSPAPTPSVPGPTDTPPDGHTFLFFGDTKIDVVGQVEMRRTKQKPFWQLLLPTGAPALSEDKFDVVPQADGTVLYTPKSAMPFRMTSTTVAKPFRYLNLAPVQMRQIIALNYDGLNVSTGPVATGESIFSIPYSYSDIYQLSDDLVAKTLFGPATIVLKKGTVGFNAGKFSGDGGPKVLLCFFANSGTDTYAVPTCFLNLRDAPSTLMGNFGDFDDKPDLSFDTTKAELAHVGTTNNIPSGFSAASQSLISGLKSPLLNHGGITIDHKFNLKMVSRGWNGDILHVTFISEGREVCRLSLAAAADGVVHLPYEGHELTLHKAVDNSGAIVAGISDPDPKASVQSALVGLHCDRP